MSEPSEPSEPSELRRARAVILLMSINNNDIISLQKKIAKLEIVIEGFEEAVNYEFQYCQECGDITRDITRCEQCLKCVCDDCSEYMCFECYLCTNCLLLENPDESYCTECNMCLSCVPNIVDGHYIHDEFLIRVCDGINEN